MQATFLRFYISVYLGLAYYSCNIKRPVIHNEFKKMHAMP